MSNISTRLATDDALNPTVFGRAVNLFLESVLPVDRIRDFLNDHITENTGQVLTTAEESDIAAMKTYYGGLTVHNKAVYRDSIKDLSEFLRDGRVTEAEWDTMLLGS